MRTAKTWPEALEKQVYLMDSYAKSEMEENFRYETYFTDCVNCCNRALEIWQIVKASKQEKIDDLQRQLETAQTEIRVEVARQLHAENDRRGWKGVASSIGDDVDLNSWLDW